MADHLREPVLILKGPMPAEAAAIPNPSPTACQGGAELIASSNPEGYPAGIGELAQLVERCDRTAEARGSNPLFSISFYFSALGCAGSVPGVPRLDRVNP